MKSIRNIVFSWFFISMLTFFSVVAIATYFVSHKLIRDFVMHDHQRLLGYMATNVEANLIQHIEALSGFTEHPDFVHLKKNKANSELESFLNFTNIYNSIHMYSKNGDLILARKRAFMGKYEPKPNIYEQKDPNVIELFKNTVSSGNRLISGISRARSGLLYQIYAVPIKNPQGATENIIMGSFSPKISDFNFLLHGLSLAENNFVSLYGEQVDVMAQFPPQGSQADIDAISKQAAQTTGVATDTATFENEKYIVMSRYLPRLKYWLVLGIHKDIIISKEKSVLHYLFLLFCGGSLFCLALSHFLGIRISRPFELLVQGFKQLHLGAFQHRIDYNKNDEIGYLCHLFNRMADKIQKDRLLGDFWTNEEELEKIKNGEKL